MEGGHLWEPPEKSYVKINCDGAWQLGFGCIARDEYGVVVAVFAGAMESANTSQEAEGTALLKAMVWARERKWEKCVFETDCAEAFSLLSSRSSKYRGDQKWVDEGCRMLIEEKYWKVNLVRREGNTAADLLAKKARSEGWSWNSNVALPWIPGIFI